MITTKGIPNHDFESMTGCCAMEQNKVYKIPITPVEDTDGEYSDVPLRGPIAFTVTGVAIYGPEDGPGGDAVALDNGYYVETRQQIDLGLCGGHSGPGGEYHYHWDANCIHWHDQTLQSSKSSGGVLKSLWESYSIDKIDKTKQNSYQLQVVSNGKKKFVLLDVRVSSRIENNVIETVYNNVMILYNDSHHVYNIIRE